MTVPPPLKPMDVVREVIRLQHYTDRTQSDWIRRYLPLDPSTGTRNRDR